MPVFHCTLTFEEYEQPLNLPPEVLQSYLEKDVIKMCKANLKSFKNSFLFHDNVGYVFNTKNVIGSMKKN